MGTENFMSNIKSYFSYSNVDAVVKGCNIFSSSGNDYSFCCEKKEVKYMDNGNKEKEDFSCGEIRVKNFTGGKIMENIKCEEVKC